MPSSHRVAVLGAAGFGGAVCAQICARHPPLELTMLTARSGAGRRHDELYPAYRVPLELEELDFDRVAGAPTRRWSRSRTRPPPRRWSRCASAA